MYSVTSKDHRLYLNNNLHFISWKHSAFSWNLHRRLQANAKTTQMHRHAEVLLTVTMITKFNCLHSIPS